MSIGGQKFNISSKEGVKELLLDMVISSPLPGYSKKTQVKDALFDTGSDYTLLHSSSIQGLKLVYGGLRQITGVHNETKKVKFYSMRITINSIIDDVFDV